MLPERYKIIPKDIMNCGISLEDLGINEFVWKKDCAVKIIEILRKENIAVLGGDVYKIVDNMPVITYDNWFANNEEKESFTDISLNKALSYIEEYECENCGENIYYSLVF